MKKYIKYLFWFLVIVALVFIGSGLYVACRIYNDYQTVHNGSVHFESASSTISDSKEGSNLSDLGSILSGSASVLITTGGIILLLLTIVQTQTELSETRELMSTQIIESTFFNLLKNHKDVIVGNDQELIKEIIFNTRQHLSSYNSSLRNMTFLVDDSTKLHPKFEYKNAYVQNIGKSMVHIASLIEKIKLDDNRSFYHQTFYYNLSDDEKFLFGMVIENDLEVSPKFGFNYSEYYNSSSPYKNTAESGYFPPLRIHTLKGLTFIYLPSFDISEEFSNIIEPKTGFYIEYLEEETKIAQIRYRCEVMDKSSSISGFFTIDEGKFDFSKLFYDRNFQTYIKVNKELRIFFEFGFSYKKEIISVCLPVVIIRARTINIGEMPHNTEVGELVAKYNSQKVIEFLLYYEQNNLFSIEDF